MTESVQAIIAGFIVAAAVSYVLLRFWRFLHGCSHGCGPCRSCTTAENPNNEIRSPSQLIEIQDARAK